MHQISFSAGKKTNLLSGLQRDFLKKFSLIFEVVFDIALVFGTLPRCHAVEDDASRIGTVDEGVGAEHPVGDIFAADRNGIALFNFRCLIDSIGNDAFVFAVHAGDTGEPYMFIATARCGEADLEHIPTWIVVAACQGAVESGQVESGPGDGGVHFGVVGLYPEKIGVDFAGCYRACAGAASG
jgi:hypothetical protein